MPRGRKAGSASRRRAGATPRLRNNVALQTDASRRPAAVVDSDATDTGSMDSAAADYAENVYGESSAQDLEAERDRSTRGAKLAHEQLDASMHSNGDSDDDDDDNSEDEEDEYEYDDDSEEEDDDDEDGEESSESGDSIYDLETTVASRSMGRGPRAERNAKRGNKGSGVGIRQEHEQSVGDFANPCFSLPQIEEDLERLEVAAQTVVEFQLRMHSSDEDELRISELNPRCAAAVLYFVSVYKFKCWTVANNRSIDVFIARNPMAVALRLTHRVMVAKAVDQVKQMCIARVPRKQDMATPETSARAACERLVQLARGTGSRNTTAVSTSFPWAKTCIKQVANVLMLEEEGEGSSGDSPPFNMTFRAPEKPFDVPQGFLETIAEYIVHTCMWQPYEGKASVIPNVCAYHPVGTEAARVRALIYHAGLIYLGQEEKKPVSCVVNSEDAKAMLREVADELQARIEVGKGRGSTVTLHCSPKIDGKKNSNMQVAKRLEQLYRGVFPPYELGGSVGGDSFSKASGGGQGKKGGSRRVIRPQDVSYDKKLKGAQRQFAHYNALADEIVSFLAQNPNAKKELELPPCAKDVAQGLIKFTRECGAMAKIVGKGQRVTVLVRGKDGFDAPTKREMQMIQEEIMDERLHGKKAGKKARKREQKKKEGFASSHAGRAVPSTTSARGRRELERTLDAEPIDSSNRGHRMLRQMGWAGEGLGAGEAGIRDPIQPTINPGRRGLG